MLRHHLGLPHLVLLLEVFKVFVGARLIILIIFVINIHSVILVEVRSSVRLVVLFKRVLAFVALTKLRVLRDRSWLVERLPLITFTTFALFTAVLLAITLVVIVKLMVHLFLLHDGLAEKVLRSRGEVASDDSLFLHLKVRFLDTVLALDGHVEVGH